MIKANDLVFKEKGEFNGLQEIYCRDSQKHEVDLIYQVGSELIPIEIKAAQTFSYDFLRGIRYFCHLKQCEKSYVIYCGDQNIPLKETSLIHYQNTANIITDSA